MHARELAELGALLAVNSPVIAKGAAWLPARLNEEYWAASKCRLDRWGRVLLQLTGAAGQVEIPATLAWPRVRPVLEEILVSELLTRLWTATACACDASSGEENYEPVARNIFVGHLDARRRLLGLLADGRVIGLAEAVKLNHLRRKVERWTDMLLAHLAPVIDAGEFAFEKERAKDFAEDLGYPSAHPKESAHAERRFTCQIVLVSLRASFAQGLAERAASGDLNRRIGSTLLGTIREEGADPAVVVKSLWVERMSRMASEAEGMVEELVRMDGEG
jgi:hypothetical protein